MKRRLVGDFDFCKKVVRITLWDYKGSTSHLMANDKGYDAVMDIGIKVSYDLNGVKLGKYGIPDIEDLISNELTKVRTLFDPEDPCLNTSTRFYQFYYCEIYARVLECLLSIRYNNGWDNDGKYIVAAPYDKIAENKKESESAKQTIMGSQKIGIFKFGYSWVEIHLRKGTGGEFLLQQVENVGAPPLVTVGICENYSEYRFENIKAILLHELFEFAMAQNKSRFAASSDFSQGSAGWIFVMDHTQFSDCCQKVAGIMYECWPKIIDAIRELDGL